MKLEQATMTAPRRISSLRGEVGDEHTCPVPREIRPALSVAVFAS
jgi:hypothetical protein